MITGIPVVIRGAMVTSSTIPALEADETAWVNATVYAVGNTRSYAIGTLTHKFECKLAHTSDTATGKIPEAYPDDATNLYWIDLGAINKFAMFQLERNTQTLETTSPLIVEVDPGERVGAIGLGNLQADDVTIDIYDSVATLVSTETKSLLTRTVTNWYEWTYRPYRQVKNTLFTDLGMNTTHTFKLTLTRASGSVGIGAVVPFVPFDIGTAQYAAKIRSQNFTSFTYDFDGEVKIVPRRSIPKINLTLHITKPALDGVRDLINVDLNGVVTVWAGIVEASDDYFDSVFVIGVCKDVEYSLDQPDDLMANIEIQGI